MKEIASVHLSWQRRERVCESLKLGLCDKRFRFSSRSRDLVSDIEIKTMCATRQTISHTKLRSFVTGQQNRRRLGEFFISWPSPDRGSLFITQCKRDRLSQRCRGAPQSGRTCTHATFSGFTPDLTPERARSRALICQ